MHRARKRRECIHSFTASRQTRRRHCSHLDEYGKPVKPSRLGAKTYIQIRSSHNSGGVVTTAKIDDKHPPTLSTSTTDHRERYHRDKEDEQKPRTVPKHTRQECTFFNKNFFSNITCNFPRYSNSCVPTQSQCKVRSLTTRFWPLPGQSHTSCSSIAADPIRLFNGKLHDPSLSKLLAAC